MKSRVKVYPAIPLQLEPDNNRWVKAKARSRRLRRHRLSDEEKEKYQWLTEPEGHGHQIVREVRACPTCAEKARQSERMRLPGTPKAIPDSISPRVSSSRASA